MRAVMKAVQKQKPYSYANHLIIKTDHQSLDYLFEQCMYSILQQKMAHQGSGARLWNHNKKGAKHKAGELSILNEENSELCQICIAIPQWPKEVMEAKKKLWTVMKETSVLRNLYPTYGGPKSSN